MPRLVCRSCGQTIYTTAPFEALYADERRCRRCGKLLFADRRSGVSRRAIERRETPPEPASAAPVPMPPDAAPLEPGEEGPSGPDGTQPAVTERRVGERRKGRRRRDDQSPFQRDDGGWVE